MEEQLTWSCIGDRVMRGAVRGEKVHELHMRISKIATLQGFLERTLVLF